MELYYKYQPVTWWIGVIDAKPDDVAEVIQPLYMPDETLVGIFHKEKPIEQILENMAPLGPHNKFLLILTNDKRTALFCNGAGSGMVELPTWYASKNLQTPAYYVCNIPNTISRDQMSGAWGARILEYRTTKTPYNKEPEFGVQLINDAGPWCFYRFGEKQPFENEKAYKSYRKIDRFTVEMLINYCKALGIPVYDREFYSDKCVIIEEKPKPDQKGLSYEEAAIKLRIRQDDQQGKLAPV
jgi:hypothetical protein